MSPSFSARLGVCRALACLLIPLSSPAFAADPHYDASFSDAISGLSRNEVRGSNLSKQWRGSSATMTRGSDGKVIYLFGQSQPSVVCSPLQLCEIELQAGETLRDLLVGDSVRWKVEPATSGSDQGQQVHLIVKASEPDLETSMVVTTSRRTYHIRLRSHERDYMARVSFDYPEDVNARIRLANARLEGSIIPGAGIPAEQLDFRFVVKGEARWRPSRVYTDGTKTYIQFPGHLKSGDAPVLFVVAGGENQIVNYRLKGSLMIIDTLFDQAVLLSGTGRHQQRIQIIRKG